ncbi:MAG: polysaccharide deacetylase family protein [Solirubrobacterales bacterium]|nr:polysaccharide deacetylase family protein [Solirubrobacterales bacterium]
MTPRRKLSFALAALLGTVLIVVFATQAQPAALTSPLALYQGDLRQDGNRVEFTIDTAGPVDTGTLDGLPDMDDGKSRFLCLELTAESGGRGARVCLAPEDRVGITPIGPDGGKPSTVEAEILRPGNDRITARFPYGLLDLDPGRYRFRFVSSDGSCGSRPDDRCVDSIPQGQGPGFNLRVPALTGCQNDGGREVRNGARDQKAVALTFDDGPGVSTPEILRILREKRVDATFFLLSSMISQDPEAVKQIPRQGSEVANHSIAHAALPPLSDIEQANQAISEASGVTPCAFRPPYGAVDASLVARARQAGLDTVLWDVDTEDWQSYTTIDSILANVKTNATNGSIILMHDGGDQPRPKTIELLPKLIDQLRNDGFALVTVSELLGNEITWEPLGKP